MDSSWETMWSVCRVLGLTPYSLVVTLIKAEKITAGVTDRPY